MYTIYKYFVKGITAWSFPNFLYVWVGKLFPSLHQLRAVHPATDRFRPVFKLAAGLEHANWPKRCPGAGPLQFPGNNSKAPDSMPTGRPEQAGEFTIPSPTGYPDK